VAAEGGEESARSRKRGGARASRGTSKRTNPQKEVVGGRLSLEIEGKDGELMKGV